VPTTFITGKHDVLASACDMKTAAELIPHAEYVELVGSHFIQMERPHEVHQHLLALLDRSQT
jgi:pimeloyl-ACP methyl ester carboxylesterase